MLCMLYMLCCVQLYICILLTLSIINRWEKQRTTGTPPPGVGGYGSCSSGTNIYYFGGYCGHPSCFHNSLFLLDVRKPIWTELFATTDRRGPMQKEHCALLAFDDQFLAFGGRGMTYPSKSPPLAKYEKDGSFICTNEHHLFDRNRGERVTF